MKKQNGKCSKKEEGHYNQLKLTKAIEKEMGNITFAKYLRSTAKRSVPQSKYTRWRKKSVLISQENDQSLEMLFMMFLWQC